MKKLIKIFLGLILLGAGVYFTYPGMSLASWGRAAVELMKGGITILVFLIGLMLVVIGFNDLKN